MFGVGRCGSLGGLGSGERVGRGLFVVGASRVLGSSCFGGVGVVGVLRFRRVRLRCVVAWSTFR